MRIEQLYPFPAEDYAAALARYPNAREIVWCQEEPQNQGAWYQIRHRLQDPLQAQPGTAVLRAARPAAAPATGILQLHVDAAARPRRRGDHRLHAGTVVARHHAPARHGQQQEEVMSTIEVRVPQLPESVADATLVAWHKQPGDAVKRDENLVDLETDKVVLEVPAPASGVLREIKVQNGATVTSGQMLAVLEEGAVARPLPLDGASRPPASAAAAGRRGREAGRDGRRQARAVGAPPGRRAQARAGRHRRPRPRRPHH